MKNNINITLALLLFCIFIQTSCVAFDLNDNFSNRSLILNTQTSELSQEMIDLLKSKQLVPTTNCLIEQIKKNKLENVQILINAKVDLNSSYYTEYPIYIAAKNNNFEILKLLYENGAKIEKGFSSELFEAVKNKNAQMAKFLIEKGADINYQDMISAKSILYYSLKNNLDEIVKILIEKKVVMDRESIKIIKKKKLKF